jgi:DNA-directed RNA polymerase specialized sigma24 family protein
VPDPRPSAVESLVLKDSIAILEDCIAKLPPHLRDVLVHRVFNEAKVKDTSVALGISIGEVSKRFSKAMARVKECGEQQAQSMPLMPPGKKVRGANVIRGDAGDF